MLVLVKVGIFLFGCLLDIYWPDFCVLGLVLLSTFGRLSDLVVLACG